MISEITELLSKDSMSRDPMDDSALKGGPDNINSVCSSDTEGGQAEDNLLGNSVLSGTERTTKQINLHL